MTELAVLPYTKLGRNLDHYGITVGNDRYDNWTSSKTGVTVEQRKLYFEQLKNIISKECGFSAIY
jgi:hypothetical protein